MPLNNSTTYRDSINFPSTLTLSQALERYRPIELERSRLKDGHLIFDHIGGFARALEQGFFLVEIPPFVNVGAGDKFALNFHRAKVGDEGDEFRGYREIDVCGAYQGYFDRPYDQWENFYIEKSNWKLLPATVRDLGQRMADVGLGVLRSTFDYLDIPLADWPVVSGGLTEDLGHQMLAFNHFRTEKNTRGCKFHRDSGWVTVLRSTEPGLFALVEDSLRAINPVSGYFIINFGSSFEVLTKNLTSPVKANIHGVAHIEPHLRSTNRTSYTVFLDSSLNGDIYQYQQGIPKAIQSVADFAVQEVERTYDHTNRL